MNQIKNVEEAFANWLQKTSPVSYKQYIGKSVEQTRERLREIANFFPERNIFSVENDNIWEIIEFIKRKTHKRERENNPDFVKYDTFHSNGIPKAIIGKNNYFKFLEEISRNKDDNSLNQTLLDLIEAYKKRIAVSRLEDEKYKWRFISEYQGKPDVNALNFEEEIKAIKFNNLVYQLSTRVLIHIVTERTEELRELFKILFNNSIPLDQRIERWEEEISKLYKQLNQQHQHHQDERAISIYLTLKYPDHYTFFKDSYYKKFCKLLEVQHSSKGHKYSHYMELIQVFVNDYISKDPELTALVKEMIPEYYDGSNNLLLAQDILYQILDQEIEPNFWVFQGNPDIYNITDALINGNIEHWKVGAHKDKIKRGDKVILWQSGKKAGCYALADVISDVGFYQENTSESQYYLNEPTDEEQTRVKIKIIANLAENPILLSEIKSLPVFENFKGGNQGTNFTATKDQFNTLLKMYNENQHLKVRGEDELKEIIKAHKKQDILNYFKFIDEVIERFEIKPEDPRVVTGTSSKQLNLTIGQRYCWNLYRPKRKKGIFGIVTSHRTNNTSEAYAGSGEQPFYNYFDNYEFVEKNRESALSAIEKELARTTKSSFLEYNNDAYRKAIFDADYREFILMNSDYTGDQGLEEKTSALQAPVNKILYGPPGTGKTYELKNLYFPNYTLKETSITKETFFEETLRELTWWQVLALALLEMGTSKVNNLLENRWVAGKANVSESKNVRATLWGTLQMHTIQESVTVNYNQRQNPLIFDKNSDKSWSLLHNELQEQYPELLEILDAVNNFKANPQAEIKHYVFTTFHQSFSYEDFVEGIKPKMASDTDDSNLSYQIQNGVFKDLCLRAQSDPDNRYAIFIDEINRGNVSAIFGELITLIEADKRFGAKNEIKVRLPYSKTDFGVPMNVDIYGTMNTADRSVEALDTALRRRFSFKEIMPKPSLLEHITFQGFNLREVLETINERIEFLLDRDHTIGHSYFLNLESGDTDGLEDVFRNKIIPLLQEYFYHDYEKIALILGAGFLKVTTNHAVKFPKLEGIMEPDTMTRCELINDIGNIEQSIHKLLQIDAD